MFINFHLGPNVNFQNQIPTSTAVKGALVEVVVVAFGAPEAGGFCSGISFFISQSIKADKYKLLLYTSSYSKTQIRKANMSAVDTCLHFDPQQPEFVCVLAILLSSVFDSSTFYHLLLQTSQISAVELSPAS